MPSCDDKIHSTTLKEIDISGVAKDAIEEAVLAQILNQVVADRAKQDKQCSGDCPNGKKCTTMISVLYYREKIADKLVIDAYRDDDDQVSYRVQLPASVATQITVGSYCFCAQRKRPKVWF